MSNKFYFLRRLGPVLVRIIVFIAVIIGAKWLIKVIANPVILPWLNHHSAASYKFADNMSGEAVLSAAIFIAYGLMRFRQPKREKRAAATKKQAGPFVVLRAGVGFAFTFVFGAILVIALFLLLNRCGYYSIISVDDQFPDAWQISYFLLLAITEELFARKYIQNIAEEKLGSGTSLVVTTVVFSLIHLRNEGSATSLPIALQTLYVVSSISFFLSAAYLLTRQIWIPIALHWSIDFFIVAFAGDDVSGGAFVANKSNYLPIQSVFFVLIGIITIAIAVKRGQWRALPRPHQTAMTTETAMTVST